MRKILILFLLAATLSLCSCFISVRPASDTTRPAGRSEETANPAVSESGTENSAEASTTEPVTVNDTNVDAADVIAETGDEERIEELLSAMSVEEKVGQMFLVRAPDDNIASVVTDYAPGGLVFFSSHFENRTTETAAAMISEAQAASKTPMLTAVDEEGGTVVRVSKYPAYRSQPFLSPREIYAAAGGGDAGITALYDDASEKSALLASLGINVNLAPVCDITTGEDEFMYKRSLGEDAQTTSAFVTTVVEASAEHGVASVLKHFPGYGPCPDTHNTAAHDTRPYEAFSEKDFLPFTSGIEAGAQAVMVSHLIVDAFDADRPASLSTAVHAALRGALGFTGVIMTDDLSMGAVGDYAGTEEAAVLAIEAGNDIIATSDYAVQIPAVLNAVSSGRLTVERINESVRRILQWKIDAGILK